MLRLQASPVPFCLHVCRLAVAHAVRVERMPVRVPFTSAQWPGLQRLRKQPFQGPACARAPWLLAFSMSFIGLAMLSRGRHGAAAEQQRPGLITWS